MKKIDIYIEKREDLVETYDKEFVSNTLIEYILSKAAYLKKNENAGLVLHVTNQTKGCSDMIRRGLEEEYNKSIKRRDIINIRQLILLILGLCILFVSTLISTDNIFHEVILIGGWVPIWEAIELELLTDTKEKKRRKQLKKLIKSNIDEVLL